MSWLLKSSIGRKFVMAISGLCMVLFLLFHMSMNLVSIFSMEAYEWICAFLGTNWYALAGTAALAGLFLVHICYAIWLTLKNRTARGSSYATTGQADAPWSSKNMFVLGIALLAFMLVHLYDFWFKMMFSELVGLPGAVFAHNPGEVGAHVLLVFGEAWRVVVYLIGIIALWFHLAHGVWSMFQSVGLSGRVWSPRLKCVAYIVGTIICIGFAIVPIFFFAKSILG